MPQLMVTETHLHGRNRYHAGDGPITVDDDHFAIAVEAGWGHAPGSPAPELDRNRIVDLDVDTLTGNTNLEEA